MTRYPRLGLPLTLELVNTEFASGGVACDALATTAELDEWLALNGFEAARSTRHDLERFRQLRGVLRRLFAAAASGTLPTRADVQALNAVSAAAPRFEQLEWDRSSGPHRNLRETASPQSNVLAAVARSAIDVLTQTGGISQCQGPGCVLFFLRDARRRHWCSAACGNRARVARHYVRHRRESQTT